MIEMLNNSFTAERLGRNTLFPNINIKDTIEMNIIITRLKGLGISIADGFSSTTEQKDEQLKKDEYIAKICVYSGKSVPEDVEQRLLDYLYSKNNIQKKSVDITINDKELEDFINGHN